MLPSLRGRLGNIPVLRNRSQEMAFTNNSNIYIKQHFQLTWEGFVLKVVEGGDLHGDEALGVVDGVEAHAVEAHDVEVHGVGDHGVVDGVEAHAVEAHAVEAHGVEVHGVGVHGVAVHEVEAHSS